MAPRGSFEDCQFYTYDRYWQEIFSNCTRNKFPKGLSYSKAKHAVYLRLGKKRETIPLPTRTAELFTTMMEIFREKMGLKSPTDQLQSQSQLDKEKAFRPPIDVRSEWKDLSRHQKDLLLFEFVKKMSAQHTLSPKEMHVLFSFIELHTLLKNIGSANVVYEQEHGICNIRGITFNEYSRTFFTSQIGLHDVTGSNSILVKTPASHLSDRFLKLLVLYTRT